MIKVLGGGWVEAAGPSPLVGAGCVEASYVSCKVTIRTLHCHTGVGVDITRMHVNWILIDFPQDETDKQQKISRPWHGPCHIISCNDPGVTAVKIFFQWTHQCK